MAYEPINHKWIRDIDPYSRFKKTAKDILNEMRECSFIIKIRQFITGESNYHNIEKYEIKQFEMLLSKATNSETRGEATQQRKVMRDQYSVDNEWFMKILSDIRTEYLVVVSPCEAIERFFGLSNIVKIRFARKRKEYFIELII